MKHFGKWLTLWALLAAAVLTALALTAATYAWFTANREVETDRVVSRTGSEWLELQLSRRGGSEFTPETDASGGNQVSLMALNQALMPVSTADLQTFVYCPVTQNEQAERFLPVTDESLYYHDTVYLRAAAEGMPEGFRMALYLDNTDVPLVQDEDGELLTAARLGMTLDGENPVIFALSEVNEGAGNSMPGGVPLESGKVLTYRDGAVVPADDPAILLSDRQIPTGGSAATQPIAYLELNRVYTLDIYFYLEGCDPDCLVERVARDSAVLNLAFFGLLVE